MSGTTVSTHCSCFRNLLEHGSREDQDTFGLPDR
jgi:hypothetical protein